MMTLIVDDGGACWKDGYDDVDDGDDDAYKCEVFDQNDHVGACSGQIVLLFTICWAIRRKPNVEDAHFISESILILKNRVK